jgi:ABC-type sugar transport system substrate-binding protein
MYYALGNKNYSQALTSMVKNNQKRAFLAWLLKISIFILAIIQVFLLQSFANALEPKSTVKQTINVLMVNPSITDDVFWGKTQIITEQAARALGVNLTVIHGEGTRFFQFDAIKKYFSNKKNKTDYVLVLNYPGNAKTTMDYLQQQDVKIITFERTLSEEERELIGNPGGVYSNWLGEIFFSNQQASFLLASSLIELLMSQNKEPIVAGISGHFGSESYMRNNGLHDAIIKYDARLTQIVHAGWSAENAYEKTLKLLSRYPDINIIWAASDHMALGALRAVEHLGLIPGKDVLIGGFDWTEKAIRSINNDKISASVGGHFMMGAIAMIVIYDLENNNSHQPPTNSTHNSFNLALMTKSNVKKYYDLLTLNDFSDVDFKKLALLYSSEEKISTFNLLDMLDASTKK